MSLSITGQRVAKAVDVESLPLVAPIISSSDILDTSAPINNPALSGKRKGACVLVEQDDGSLVMAVARGASPVSAWDVPVTEVPGRVAASLDVFNWTGEETLATGNYLNLLTLDGLTHSLDGSAVLSSDLLTVPAIEESTIMTVTVRLTGTTDNSGNQEWRIQLRRPNGTTIISSVGAWRSGSALNFNYRESTISTYTNSATDPYSVDGFQVGLHNPSGQQAMNLTGVSIRIARIPG